MVDNVKDVEINQKSGVGSTTTQIGVQNVYNGITSSDAVNMVMELFRQYYPVLRVEALTEVRKMIEDELNKLKRDEIIVPKAKIIVPTLENASITEEKELRMLYAKLLVKSMSEKDADSVHPAYVHIINQMSIMDALVLKKIAQINDSIPVARVTFTIEQSQRYLAEALPHFYSPYFNEFDDMKKVSTSIENLSRLQIINLFSGSVITYDYNTIKNEDYIQEQYGYAKSNNPERELEIEVENYTIQRTDFGKDFIRLCVL